MKRTIRVLALLALTGVLPAYGKEGFNFFSKTVATVVRVNPPAVYLMSPKIHVKVTSSGSIDASLAQRLQSQLESGLISRDSRLVIEPNRPETLVEVSILQNDRNERWEDRKENALVNTGTDNKGKPVLGIREVTVRYKVVNHAFAASYKVTDKAKSMSLDANSLHFDFKNDFRDGKDAPEIFTLESSAIGQVVEAISQRITPTREKIGVLIPKGSLQDLANLAAAGQWNLYLEALERRSPSQKPADEAYRQYALGVAYEALGYAAEEPADTLKYLEQASGYYNKALETNPGEKYFTQAYDSLLGNKKAAAPLERVQTALANYRKIKNFQEQYASLQAAAQQPASGAKALESRTDFMDNSAVIRMVRAGLPTDVILTSIETAPSPSFDVSPQGLVALSDAQVDHKIIQRLQEVATGKKKPASAKTPAKKKANMPKSAGSAHKG
jgi:hypothetical protein